MSRVHHKRSSNPAGVITVTAWTFAVMGTFGVLGSIELHKGGDAASWGIVGLLAGGQLFRSRLRRATATTAAEFVAYGERKNRLGVDGASDGVRT